ncbi:MAG: lysylphosphatidylglycerol synthase transmembrane domain-containing protein [Candidatus Longimicrobiales bacterium M2_2A_002]
MNRAGTSSSRRSFLDWKAVLGLLISAALLWFAFRDVHLAEVWDRVRRADFGLLTLSAVLATVLFPLRAFRWRPLLVPSYADSRFRPRFAATCIGFMANNLLPARVGEFARAFALSRLEPVSVSASFGSLVVERMFDGVIVVLFLVAALAWPSFPAAPERDFGTIALWAALLFGAAFVIVLVIVIRPERSVRWFERTVARLLPEAVRRPVVDALTAFLDGIGAVRDPRLVLRALAWSVVIWFTAALSIWVGMLAFGIRLPFISAVFLQSIIALAVSLPSAPGFFGVFEAAARIGLVDIWGVAAGPAVAFAIGYHLAGFIPVTAIGLYYVWRLGLSWRDVERSEAAVETAVEAGDAGSAGDARDVGDPGKATDPRDTEGGGPGAGTP